VTADLHQERPIRVPEFRLEPRDHDSLLVDAAGHQLLLLNDTALALWDLCDGTNTVDEMITAVVDLFSADVDDVRSDVASTIGRLRELGAVQYYVP
jgi:pyrroloquinoline quinone biosynthesis protein D